MARVGHARKDAGLDQSVRVQFAGDVLEKEEAKRVAGRDGARLDALQDLVLHPWIGDGGHVKGEDLSARLGTVDAMVDDELAVGGQYVVFEARFEDGHRG